jgi:hypothetical protein
MLPAIIFGILSSVGAVVGEALLLVFPDAVRNRAPACPLSYATGTLLSGIATFFRIGH